MSDLMVIGTYSTGFYVIATGSPERLSPVFSTRADARRWLSRYTARRP